MTDLTPREIVSELDRYIIGQRDAKRAAGKQTAHHRGAEATKSQACPGEAQEAAIEPNPQCDREDLLPLASALHEGPPGHCAG